MKTEDLETENRREPPLDAAEGTMVCPPLEPIGRNTDAAGAPVPPPVRKRKPSAFRVLQADLLTGKESAASLKAGRALVAKAGDGKWAIVCVREIIENKTETLVTSRRVKG